MKKVLLAISATALLLWPISSLAGQQTGAVTGTVVDASSAAPVQGASVQVTGTDLGALTDERGSFRITGVPTGTVTLQVSRIGYSEAETEVDVVAGETAQVRIQIRQATVRLEELVVTGTAGERLRREQPAQIGSIDADEITENTPIPSLSDLISAREPGVSVQLSSGQSGTGQRIRIRGNASIALSNQPLVYIDGIRADSRNALARPDDPGRFDALGGAAVSRLNDLNPEEIASIEIVKGPAAATLYGADASAGVMQIITKRGSKNTNLTHRIAFDYHSVDDNFDPPSNWAQCTQSAIAAGATLCQGKSVGALVSDNPFEREDVFQRGELLGVGWSGSGGGENYSFYSSLRWSDEDGTVESDTYDKRHGRFNAAVDPHEEVHLNLSYSLNNIINTLPMGNHSVFGIPTIGLLGNPLTVGLDSNGWIFTGGGSEALLAVDNEIRTLRNTLSVTGRYEPLDWLSTRLIVGGDFVNTERMQFFPKNDDNWYGGETDLGTITENRQSLEVITFDHLTNLSFELGSDDQWASDISIGLQWIQERQDLAVASGVGLSNNTARAVSAAAERTGEQWFQDVRSLGYLAQYQIGYMDRLFLQFGARWDEHSAFGSGSDLVFLPKVGASYVISDEDFWSSTFPFINTMRLRGAYGTTGRAPQATQALRTFSPSSFVDQGGGLGSGLTLLNPGNEDLEPERGIEFELGFDASLLNDRIGAELTYFYKKTSDLILQRPIPPSLGFQQDPFDNVGEVVNKGVEVGLNAQVVQSEAFSWNADIGLNTLDNELLSLGELAPFGPVDKRFREDFPLGAVFQHKIQSVDLERGIGIVSDTLEFLGTPIPNFEGFIASTVQFFDGQVSVRAQADWRTGHLVRNGTRDFRCKGIVTCRDAIDPDFLSEEERIRTFGPFESESGESVPSILVEEEFFEEGDFLRLRELSVGFTLPESVTSLMRASSARLTLGARNVALWTGYSGVDPEVGSNLATEFGGISEGEFFAMPPVRRWTARLNISF